MSDEKPENNNLIKFIATTVENLRDQMNEMREQMATKSDLEQMATKSDVGRLESKLDVQTASLRGDIEQVHLRLDSIERLLRMRLDNVEAEVSRLRSVLYLLVKDRPDMLRLLGHTPPSGDEGRV